VSSVQRQIGVTADGQLGPQTQRAIQSYRSTLESERNSIKAATAAAQNSDQLKSASVELQRIRRNLEEQVSSSNQVINRLREQIGVGAAANIDSLVAEQNSKIVEAQSVIERLSDQRWQAQVAARKIEAEVGPVKYIAALIYGDNPDAQLLERAVRWVIIMLVVVFDPLAIVLILASQNSLRWERERRATTPLEIQSPPTSSPLSEEAVVDTQPPPQPIVEEQSQQSQIVEDVDKPVETPPETPPPSPQWSQWNKDQIKYTVKSNPLSKLSPQSEIADTTPEVTSTSVEKIATVEPETSGITQAMYHPSKEYVDYDGKTTSMIAFSNLRPDLVLPPTAPLFEILWGTQFPKQSRIGDVYIRVDHMPHVPYKFAGDKWIKIDKTRSWSYLQNTDYLKYLISCVERGEYDPELLSEHEQEEIRLFIDGQSK
jgi:hypothetical protein